MLKSMNPGGHHIGGLLGFLRSLGYLTRILDPTKIICVFDGRGSAMNRQNINSNYKAQRDNTKITNWGMFDTKEEEKESMALQLERLMDYLECLPVTVVMYDKTEADDVISFIAQEKAKQGSRVTIVSSDKDFLQIVSDNISIYSPIKKELIDIKNVKEHIGVHPSNYLLIKALTGDSSDNLSGVKGLGIKTLIKKFPELVDKENLELDKIYQLCEQNLSNKHKVFANIIYEWDKVEKNYDIMNLQSPRLTHEEKITILNDIEDVEITLNSALFSRYLEHDKIDSINANTEGWLETFRPLTFYK